MPLSRTLAIVMIAAATLSVLTQAAAPPAPPGTVRQWSKWATDEAGAKTEWGAFVAADGTETPWGNPPAGGDAGPKKAFKKGAAGESDAGEAGESDRRVPRAAAAGEAAAEASEAGEAVAPRAAAASEAGEAGEASESGVSIKSAKTKPGKPTRRMRR